MKQKGFTLIELMIVIAIIAILAAIAVPQYSYYQKVDDCVSVQKKPGTTTRTFVCSTPNSQHTAAGFIFTLQKNYSRRKIWPRTYLR